MNASQAHNAYGVSRSTVGRWIKNGSLPADESGYFDEADFLPLNDARVKKPGPGRASTKPKAAKKKLPPTKPKAAKKKPAAKKKQILVNRPKAKQRPRRPAPAKQKPSQKAKAVASRQAEDLRKATASADKVELEVMLKLKDLISRDLVSKFFRKLYVIDATEWRGLAPRIAPDIAAVCKNDDPAVEVEISELIDGEVFRTLGHLKRRINEFLLELEVEERADDGG